MDESSMSVSREGECPICYQEFAILERRLEEGTLTSLEKTASDEPCQQVILTSCHHEFCHECLKQHCIQSIQECTVPIPCPAQNGNESSEKSTRCPSTMHDEQVKEILCKDQGDSEASHGDDSSRIFSDWNRYQQLLQIKANPNLVPCPGCHQLFDPTQGESEQQHYDDDQEEEAQNTELSCPQCMLEFCAIHGTLHPNQTCEEYYKTLRGKQDAKSRRAVRLLSKPCSHCKVPIQIAGGCDHVVCQSCKQDFCYKCGTHLYLSGDEIRSCAKCRQSFLDHRKMGKVRCRACINALLCFPAIVVYLVVATLLSLVSGCCGCCFMCGSLLKEKDGREAPTISAGLHFAPIRGLRVTLGCILLPLVDLVRQCGFSFCNSLLLDRPGEQGRPTTAESQDTVNLSVDESMQNSSYDSSL